MRVIFAQNCLCSRRNGMPSVSLSQFSALKLAHIFPKLAFTTPLQSGVMFLDPFRVDIKDASPFELWYVTH